MEDLLRNIEPVQLGVEQMCQASVDLPKGSVSVKVTTGMADMAENNGSLPPGLWLSVTWT